MPSRASVVHTAPGKLESELRAVMCQSRPRPSKSQQCAASVLHPPTAAGTLQPSSQKGSFSPSIQIALTRQTLGITAYVAFALHSLHQLQSAWIFRSQWPNSGSSTGLQLTWSSLSTNENGAAQHQSRLFLQVLFSPATHRNLARLSRKLSMR